MFWMYVLGIGCVLSCDRHQYWLGVMVRSSQRALLPPASHHGPQSIQTQGRRARA